MTFETEWARCAPWLEAALKQSADNYTLDYVLTEVMAHRATFWPLNAAALISEMVATDNGREAHIWLAGGSMRCLLTMTPAVATRLKANGFTAATIKGRPGWARALKQVGFSPSGDELRKVL